MPIAVISEIIKPEFEPFKMTLIIYTQEQANALRSLVGNKHEITQSIEDGDDEDILFRMLDEMANVLKEQLK